MGCDQPSTVLCPKVGCGPSYPDERPWFAVLPGAATCALPTPEDAVAKASSLPWISLPSGVMSARCALKTELLSIHYLTRSLILEMDRGIVFVMNRSGQCKSGYE